jgi:hypothetical protein
VLAGGLDRSGSRRRRRSSLRFLGRLVRLLLRFFRSGLLADRVHLLVELAACLEYGIGDARLLRERPRVTAIGYSVSLG